MRAQADRLVRIRRGQQRQFALTRWPTRSEKAIITRHHGMIDRGRVNSPLQKATHAKENGPAQSGARKWSRNEIQSPIFSMRSWERAAALRNIIQQPDGVAFS
jgi:hypothetical protein